MRIASLDAKYDYVRDCEDGRMGEWAQPGKQIQNQVEKQTATKWLHTFSISGLVCFLSSTPKNVHPSQAKVC